jgi:hypothetical protein
VQAVKTAGVWSSEHWNVLPVSGELNVKVAVALVLVASGFVSIVVSGAVASIVHM